MDDASAKSLKANEKDRSAHMSISDPRDRALLRWAQRKYNKRLHGHARRAKDWLDAIAQRHQGSFAHWEMRKKKTAGR